MLALTVTRRILIELWRTRRSLIFWALFPSLMLLLFGLIYTGRGEEANALDDMAPSILMGAAFFASLYGLRAEARERRVAACLTEVGLTDRAGTRVSLLSGGMRRRRSAASRSGQSRSSR